MSNSSKHNAPPKTRNLPMPVEAKQIYELSDSLGTFNGSHLSNR